MAMGGDWHWASCPMLSRQDRAHPTVPSPPHTMILKYGMLRNMYSLQENRRPLLHNVTEHVQPAREPQATSTQCYGTCTARERTTGHLYTMLRNMYSSRENHRPLLHNVTEHVQPAREPQTTSTQCYGTCTAR